MSTTAGNVLRDLVGLARIDANIAIKNVVLETARVEFHDNAIGILDVAKELDNVIRWRQASRAVKLKSLYN